ncbi:MAG: C-GCAxxG-C-C family (seleno)protein [Fusobacteriaceae bacterium]
MLKRLFKKKVERVLHNDGKIRILTLRKEAETYYRNRDFYCSEAVVKVIADYFQAPLGDAAVRLASGFPVGIGGSMCTCGAVNGGVMAISMFFGRDQAGGKEVKKAMELSKELYDKFTKKHKVACCKVLTHGKKLGSSEHIDHCVEMTGELAEITGRILARELGYEIIEE